MNKIEILLERFDKEYKFLNKPEVIEILKKHFDANITYYYNGFKVGIRLSININLDPDDIFDIRNLAQDVFNFKYYHKQAITLYEDDDGFIILEMEVKQKFTEEEKDLLRSLGKIEKIEDEVIVCR